MIGLYVVLDLANRDGRTATTWETFTPVKDTCSATMEYGVQAIQKHITITITILATFPSALPAVPTACESATCTQTEDKDVCERSEDLYSPFYSFGKMKMKPRNTKKARDGPLDSRRELLLSFGATSSFFFLKVFLF